MVFRTAQEAIAAGTPDLSGFSRARERSTRQHDAYLSALQAQQERMVLQRGQEAQRDNMVYDMSQGPNVQLMRGGNDYQRYARQQLARFGFNDPREWEALYRLWQKESNWNPRAVNRSSGAFGIAQILPSAHPTANRNMSAQEQIDWGLNYIRQRYGSPSRAWAHSQRTNWY